MVSKEFDEAKARLGTLSEDPGNDAKLKLYALFKQATVGPCNTPKPGMMDFVGKAKWSAWSQLGNISKNDAEKKYIDFVNELCKFKKPEETNAKKFTEIITSIEYGTVYKIVLNRPKKKNSFNRKMYEELPAALEEAKSNGNILFVCITGAGDYFTSGNDINNFQDMASSDTNIENLTKEATARFRSFVNTFIEFTKPIICLINGPAVGLGVTILGLVDLVFASDKATFLTPFTNLALIPEACSSYTFPLLMGNLKATEVLLFNRKLNANEAYERNLVNEVIPDEKFQTEVWKKIEQFSKLPKNSLLSGRELLRVKNKEILKQVNNKETEILEKQGGSEEAMNAVLSFMQLKSKI